MNDHTDDQNHKPPAENTEKPLNLSPKGLAQMKMMSSGVDARTTLMLTNPLKDKVSTQGIHALKQKYKRWSLQSPEIVKLAHQVVRKTLKGETIKYTQQKVTKSGEIVTYTETIAPSITNQLAAAGMVYDRYEPAKVGAPEGPRGNTYIDLSNYRVIVNNVDKPVDSVSYQPHAGVIGEIP